LNYNLLDKLTGKFVDLAFIEQPHLLNGVSSKQYWKSYLNKSAYNLLNFIGYTDYKPYSKESIYEIVNKYEINLSDLPCIMLFKDREIKEKLVITISGEIVAFFRHFVSTIQKVTKEIEDMKQQELSNIRKSIQTIVYNRSLPFEDMVKETRRQMDEGKVDPSQVETATDKIYDSRPHEYNKFSYFQSRFTEIWESDIAEKLDKKITYQYEFRGNTVFVNNPQGKIVFENFFNQTNNGKHI
jgi:hypothetical protein